jgi:hypothetical protein
LVRTYAFEVLGTDAVDRVVAMAKKHGHMLTLVLTDGNGDLNIERPSDGRSTGRRLALARWLVRPDHPLTARVMVNRIWQHHFGEGIVATPNNFGRKGELPTNPELLDWLATEFVKTGWNVKALQKIIVMSATYQQASSVTPVASICVGSNPIWILSTGQSLRITNRSVFAWRMATMVPVISL